MLFKLLAIIRRRIVWLQDYNGKAYRTWEIKTPFGFYAPVYPITNIGLVNLHPDGNTSGKSCYITKWVYE